MTSKILSRAGVSLADAYDVEGSIAGIEELDSESVKVVHEMGATMFSERFVTTFRRIVSGDIAQSLSFNVVITDTPQVPFRILGVLVFVDTTGRTNRVSVNVRDANSGREIPIWAWDSATADAEMNIQVDDDGGGASLKIVNAPVIYPMMFPLTVAGNAAPNNSAAIALRGATTAFGAGTVENTAVILIALAAEQSGLSSVGLPMPGW